MRDRRGLNRPSNGDRKTCPNCQTSFAEFSERFRFPQAGGRTAAWVCDSPSCGYSEPVRAEDQGHGAHDKRRMASMRLKPERRKKSG
jgi:hypothetical protein